MNDTPTSQWHFHIIVLGFGFAIAMVIISIVDPNEVLQLLRLI